MLEMYREEMYLLPYLSPNQVEDVFALEMHEHAYELDISPAWFNVCAFNGVQMFTFRTVKCLIL